MKIILALLAVLSIAGCVTVANDGLSLRLSADPSPVFSGSNTVLSVDIDNRNEKAISDVNVQIFDTGLLTGAECSRQYERLLSQEFQSFSCRFDAPVVLQSTTSDVSALASFSSDFFASHAFELINEAEYGRRTSSGTFTTDPKTYTYSDRYVRLDVDFSDSPPLIITPDRRYFVYFTITNIGQGFLTDVASSDFGLTSIDNENPGVTFDCPKITGEITPTGKSFPRIACEIKVPDNYFDLRSFKTSSFVVRLSYVYELRGKLTIPVQK